MTRSLDGERLVRLDEWAYLVDHIVQEGHDYMEAALDAPSYDRLQYYRGKREGLLRIIELVDELFQKKQVER